MTRSIIQRQKTKDSIIKTREKRHSQICKVYELKIDEGSLNKIQTEYLRKIFIEAKWFYNHILNQEDIFNIKVTKDKEVSVKNLDTFETRKLKFLPATIKQSLHNRVKDAVITLSRLKKLNFQVGKLKFKPEIKSIEYAQYKVTWFISNNKIKLAGCKQYFKVNGLKQIPTNVEFANLNLIRKPSGYYLKVTTYQCKQPKIKTGKIVGIDFGIKNNLTTSDGKIFNIKEPETEKLKHLQRLLTRKTKGSKNSYKNKLAIRKEYEKITNRKKDQVNKIISKINKDYDQIFIQDEMIKSWQMGLFGRSVQHSALGAIKSRLKLLQSVQVINKSLPTTKACYVCREINNISLDQRTYKCQCGLIEDRDIKAAKTILKFGMADTNTIMEKQIYASVK